MGTLIENKFWGAFLTFLPIFGMFSLNRVAIELENPFGDDPNDLPLAHFQDEMNDALLLLLVDGADIIPQCNMHRCVVDFQALKTSARPATHAKQSRVSF